MPPELGRAAASSANVRAPKRERTPPRTQNARTTAGLPRYLAMMAGDRKMPLPRMMPTMTAEPPQNPMRRGNSEGMGEISPQFAGRGAENRPGPERENRGLSGSSLAGQEGPRSLELNSATGT